MRRWRTEKFVVFSFATIFHRFCTSWIYTDWIAGYSDLDNANFTWTAIDVIDDFNRFNIQCFFKGNLPPRVRLLSKKKVLIKQLRKQIKSTLRKQMNALSHFLNQHIRISIKGLHQYTEGQWRWARRNLWRGMARTQPPITETFASVLNDCFMWWWLRNYVLCLLFFMRYGFLVFC